MGGKLSTLLQRNGKVFQYKGWGIRSVNKREAEHPSAKQRKDEGRAVTNEHGVDVSVSD